jgi:hypothetical protein
MNHLEINRRGFPLRRHLVLPLRPGDEGGMSSKLKNGPLYCAVSQLLRQQLYGEAVSSGDLVFVPRRFQNSEAAIPDGQNRSSGAPTCQH